MEKESHFRIWNDVHFKITYIYIQAEEEVCRLTREAGQGLSKRNTIHRHPMHQFSSEETELEGQLQACERELQHLSLSINSTLQVSFL